MTISRPSQRLKGSPRSGRAGAKDLLLPAGAPANKGGRKKAAAEKQGSAFITTRKGFCYLTIKCGWRNFHIMRIRAYTIDADDKRHMRRLYPEIDFDWKKIARQLAEKREVCRQYRSRRRPSDTAHRSHTGASFYGVYEPSTRTIYTDGFPGDVRAAGALLDAVLRIDRTLTGVSSSGPSGGSRRGTQPNLVLVQGGQPERQPCEDDDDC
ncbi:MAG TPA: hypothetical protein VMB34_21355 [Acetobacteraceae bacterium]|nr:hypothetical protein [Acetobacteraceae bacterium]